MDGVAGDFSSKTLLEGDSLILLDELISLIGEDELLAELTVLTSCCFSAPEKLLGELVVCEDELVAVVCGEELLAVVCGEELLAVVCGDELLAVVCEDELVFKSFLGEFFFFDGELFDEFLGLLVSLKNLLLESIRPGISIFFDGDKSITPVLDKFFFEVDDDTFEKKCGR